MTIGNRITKLEQRVATGPDDGDRCPDGCAGGSHIVVEYVDPTGNADPADVATCILCGQPRPRQSPLARTPRDVWERI